MTSDGLRVVIAGEDSRQVAAQVVRPGVHLLFQV